MGAVGRFAGVVAVFVSGSLLLATGATAEPGGEPPEPTQSPTPAHIRLNTVVDQLDSLRDDAGFGSFVLDEDRLTVTVGWKGVVPPGLTSELGKRPDGVTVAVRPVGHSESEMDALTKALGQEASRSGWPWASVRPEDGYTGLVMELDQSQVAEGSVEAVQLEQRIRAATSVPVTFEYVDGGHLDRTRQNDSDPWQGAGGLSIPARNEFCTTGFSVLTTGGYGRLLGAAHCDPNGNNVLRDGAGDLLSNGDAFVDVAPAYDSLLIDPVGGSIGKVFGGPWNAGTGNARYQFHVGGDARASKGERVCVSGANTGEHCNAEVYQAGITFSCNGGYSCPGFRVWSTNGNIIGGAGDSGAPVYIERSDGRVGARGLYVSGISGYQEPCPDSRYPAGSNGCDRRIQVVGITDLENRWNVQVEYD